MWNRSLGSPRSGTVRKLRIETLSEVPASAHRDNLPSVGTWDFGLLDNDTSLDGLGDLVHQITEDIARIGAAKPSASAAARLGGAIGVLLQLSAYSFAEDSTPAATITAAAKAQAKPIAKLPSKARQILERIGAGQGHALVGRPAKMSAAHAALLHTGSKRSSFGKREPALFATRRGAAYVQEVARRCVKMLDEDFADASNWSDLCREGVGMGGLAALMVLEPCRLPIRKLESWRRKAQQGIAELESEEDDELPFQRKYYANLDRVFAVLLRRASAP